LDPIIQSQGILSHEFGSKLITDPSTNAHTRKLPTVFSEQLVGPVAAAERITRESPSVMMGCCSINPLSLTNKQKLHFTTQKNPSLSTALKFTQTHPPVKEEEEES
jgi:hypothetical protein